MPSMYSLPDRDLQPPRVHTLGIAITAGSLLSVLAVLFTIGNATAPNVPAEVIKAARETEPTSADEGPSQNPSPSPTSASSRKPLPTAR